jgi:alpha-tubulin suppressor-like RCC1 family protein
MDNQGNSVFSCGRYHTAAVTEDGKVVCWGMNISKQCNVPEALENVESVCCGGDFSAAITQDRKVMCWGEGIQCEVPDCKM